MSDAVVIAGVSAAAALIGAAITSVVGAVYARRSARDATRVNEFEASTARLEAAVAGLEKLAAGQDKRISALERELDSVKTSLVAEQQQHAETRELLRIAMRHIRDMLAWVGGDRSSPPPRVPDELTHQL